MAGISAAIWCERLGLTCILLEREREIGGQLSQIRNEIWDFPPHVYTNGTTLLAELLQHRTVEQIRCRAEESVFSIDYESHRIVSNKDVYQAEYLIMATGMRHNQLTALQGSERILSPWFSTTAQAELFRDKDVLIIGGGDRAVESAFNISSYARQVLLVVRSEQPRARHSLVEKLKSRPNVHLFPQTEVVGCVEQANRVTVTLQTGDSSTSSTEVDWILPRIGMRGNSEGFPSLYTYGEGYIDTDSYQRSNIDWIYAIGDVTNGTAYASLSLASGQAMKAVKHISQQVKEHS